MGIGLIDLSYSVGPDSLKEAIVLQRFTGKDTWRFNLHTQGLVAYQYEDGHISLNYAESISEPVITLLPVEAVDAAGARQTGSMTLVSQAEGFYQVQVPQAWLAAPDRRYPVTIDPSVFINYPSTAEAGMYGTIKSGVTMPVAARAF